MLLVLRYGDKSLRGLLRRHFTDKNRLSKGSIGRSAAIVYASQGQDAFAEVREAAGTLLRNHLSSLVRLTSEICDYQVVPKRYSSRLSLGFDSVAGTKFVEMRVILTANLLLLNQHESVRKWVMDWRQKMIGSEISEYDRKLLRRLVK